MENKEVLEIEDQNENNEQEQEDLNEEVPVELLNEKLDIIMKKLESLNVDKEIGEKEKNRDIRLVIDKIELENFKSYAGVKRIGPLHNVKFLNN
jgi:hypothetical protein